MGLSIRRLGHIFEALATSAREDREVTDGEVVIMLEFKSAVHEVTERQAPGKPPAVVLS